MNRKFLIVLLHILFWIQNLIRNMTFNGIYSMTEILCDQLLIATMCYLNYFFLSPYILKKNEFKYYLLWLIVFIGGFTTIYAGWVFSQPYLLGIPEIKNVPIIWAISFNISFLYGAMSSGSRLAVDWTNNQDKNEKLLIQKTTSQIQWMKSNINIPFILESLRYAEKIAQEDPKKAEEPIMLLSDILRYGLYESESSQISIEREIEVLHKYMDLQNKIDPSINLKLEINSEIDHLPIIPNILLRFISVWKSLTKQKIKGEQVIKLYREGNSILLKLPLSSLIQLDKMNIKEQFPVFSNDYFMIDYKQEEEYLYLEIINLNV